MFSEPVVIAFNEFEPIAVLLPPPVFAAKANAPNAELFVPVVFTCNAFLPANVFELVPAFPKATPPSTNNLLVTVASSPTKSLFSTVKSPRGLNPPVVNVPPTVNPPDIVEFPVTPIVPPTFTSPFIDISPVTSWRPDTVKLLDNVAAPVTPNVPPIVVLSFTCKSPFNDASLVTNNLFCTGISPATANELGVKVPNTVKSSATVTLLFNDTSLATDNLLFIVTAPFNVEVLFTNNLLFNDASPVANILPFKAISSETIVWKLFITWFITLLLSWTVNVPSIVTFPSTVIASLTKTLLLKVESFENSAVSLIKALFLSVASFENSDTSLINTLFANVASFANSDVPPWNNLLVTVKSFSNVEWFVATNFPGILHVPPRIPICFLEPSPLADLVVGSRGVISVSPVSISTENVHNEPSAA